MKIGDDEQKLGEYFFKGSGDVANMSTLTNRRLVVVYGNAEESYPLSKITAVRIIYNRSTMMMLGGAFVFLIGLSAIGSSVGAGLMLLAIGGAMAYFGWKGKTQLEIGQMGGHKHYRVSGRDPRLTEFMDIVNSRIS